MNERDQSLVVSTVHARDSQVNSPLSGGKAFDFLQTKMKAVFSTLLREQLWVWDTAEPISKKQIFEMARDDPHIRIITIK